MKRSDHRAWLSCLGAFVLGAAGCTEEQQISFADKEEGESCKQVSDCKAGLKCEGKICVPIEQPPASGAGKSCTSDGDCDDGLICGRQGVCTDIVLKNAGEPCVLTLECIAPLICTGAGVCDADDGGAGTYDLGHACESLEDCRRPYVCGLNHECVRLPAVNGLDCSANDHEMGAYRVYYEVPPEGVEGQTDFYRLPFPNDIRVRGGRIDLGGHPSPGEVLGVDVTGLYYDSVEADVTGFATNAPIFLRFTDRIDPATVCLGQGGVYPPVGAGEAAWCPSGGEATVFLVDIDDPGSSTYDRRHPVELAFSAQAGQFICQNWLGVAPLAGVPLREGATYAAVVTTGVKSARGDAPIHDADFAALLAATAPEGPAHLPAAHAAMAPLRAWLQTKSIDPASIAAAAVFTTGTHTTIGGKLRQAVQAQTPLADFSDATLCDTGVVSPCDDGLTEVGHQRGCFGASAAFHEIHGRYENPVFQAGTRPYESASDGGAMVLDAQGVPQVQGSESMCFALALPKGTAPTGGWPVVIYGHGTGGSFRSHTYDGTAELLTSLGFAVLGFDNVMHGERQGVPAAQWKDPGDLFFNPVNPRASRDNILQGAADLFWLTRLLRAKGMSVGGVGTVQFDPAAVYYYGHSQGTVIAPAFLAFETDIAGAFMSGAGAELALSILNKREPAQVGQAVGALFGDRSISRIHPMIGLMSLLFGSADSINYAKLFVKEPPSGRAPKPLLQIYGIGDNFTPDVTQAALIRAAGLPFVGSVEQGVPGISIVGSPASGTVNGVTAGALQYSPDGAYDGHFVAFHRAAARTAIGTFFSTALGGAALIRR